MMDNTEIRLEAATPAKMAAHARIQAANHNTRNSHVTAALTDRRPLGRERRVKWALCGSSSPAACTSRTDAAGGSCSGRTRPDRPACPAASATQQPPRILSGKEAEQSYRPACHTHARSASSSDLDL